MTNPTGALSVVQDFMDRARKCEALAENMVKNEAYNTAIDQKLHAEKLKTQAGIEFLLWMLARLNMSAEPNPWQEHLEKERLKEEQP